MKKLLFILSVCSLAACGEKKPEVGKDKNLLSSDLVNNPATAAGATPADMEKLATMDFVDTLHNFGNIKEGEAVTYDFEFQNNGKSPLIISSAAGSCGCTVPDYPRQPVQPGAKGVVKVKFNSEGKPNHQEKSVSINTNSGRGMYMLYIKADVEPRK